MNVCLLQVWLTYFPESESECANSIFFGPMQENQGFSIAFDGIWKKPNVVEGNWCSFLILYSKFKCNRFITALAHVFCSFTLSLCWYFSCFSTGVVLWCFRAFVVLPYICTCQKIRPHHCSPPYTVSKASPPWFHKTKFTNFSFNEWCSW